MGSKDFKNSEIKGPFRLDLDSNKNLEEARIEALKVISFCAKKYNVLLEDASFQDMLSEIIPLL